MTPIEKAKHLVAKYIQLTPNTSIVFHKQCALIAVEEIDNAIDFDWMEVQNLDRQHAYWQQVKEEISKM